MVVVISVSSSTLVLHRHRPHPPRSVSAHLPCETRVFTELSLFVVDRDGLQVLRFEDLSATGATNVVHAVCAGQHFRSIVRAGAFHNTEQTYFKERDKVVKSFLE